MGQPIPPTSPTPKPFTTGQRLKQYEFYANTAEKVIDRRNGINRFFITIHTGLLTLITIVAGVGLSIGINTSSTQGNTSAVYETPIAIFLVGAQGEIGLLLCLLGLLLSVIWSLNISQYRKLNTAKYDVITKMEADLPYQAFAEEWRILMGGQRASGPRVRQFRQVTRVEQLLPTVALIVYIAIGATFGFASGLFQALLTLMTHL